MRPSFPERARLRMEGIPDDTRMKTKKAWIIGGRKNPDQGAVILVTGAARGLKAPRSKPWIADCRGRGDLGQRTCSPQMKTTCMTPTPPHRRLRTKQDGVEIRGTNGRRKCRRLMARKRYRSVQLHRPMHYRICGYIVSELPPALPDDDRFHEDEKISEGS